MLLFGLGTLPLMLGVGMLGNLFQKKKELVQKIMSIFIILLSLSMCYRGLSALGIRWDGTGNATVTTLTYSSYGDIAVKKGIPYMPELQSVTGGLLCCTGRETCVPELRKCILFR